MCIHLFYDTRRVGSDAAAGPQAWARTVRLDAPEGRPRKSWQSRSSIVVHVYRRRRRACGGAVAGYQPRIGKALANRQKGGP